MYTLTKLLNVTWRIAWSGYLRLLLGGNWWYKLQNFHRISQIRNYPRDRLFFATRDLGNGFAQVWVPDGIVIQPTDSLAYGYEIYVLDVYNKLYKIRSNDVVIDIGAHVGIFTLKAAKRAKNGLIVAIEPHPSNFNILVKNIKLNKLENVIPLNIALADHNDWTELYISKASGGHTITPPKAKEKRLNKIVKVKARNLDFVIDELGIKKVNFIKVDVEGAELEVLAGAQNVLKSNKDLRVAIASYHYPNEAQEVSDFLALRGFKVSVGPYVYGIA